MSSGCDFCGGANVLLSHCSVCDAGEPCAFCAFDLRDVIAALDAGADPNAWIVCDGQRLTPLHVAAWDPSRGKVTALIDRGAVPQADPDGKTPLDVLGEGDGFVHYAEERENIARAFISLASKGDCPVGARAGIADRIAARHIELGLVVDAWRAGMAYRGAVGSQTKPARR